MNTADLLFVAKMPTLKEYAARCRHLALTVRSDVVREHLLVMAKEMERQAGVNDRAVAAATDRKAG